MCALPMREVAPSSTVSECGPFTFALRHAAFAPAQPSAASFATFPESTELAVIARFFARSSDTSVPMGQPPVAFGGSNAISRTVALASVV